MNYYKRLRLALERVDTDENHAKVDALVTAILGGAAFVCGNGGSAAIASHFAADLNKTAGRTLVTSLCDSVPMITALSNDVSYDMVFKEQLVQVGVLETLVCVSSSGSSPNVVNAARYAHGIGANVFALTGFSRHNVLNTIPGVTFIHVDSTDYGVVEDSHMAVLHDVVERIREMS